MFIIKSLLVLLAGYGLGSVIRDYRFYAKRKQILKRIQVARENCCGSEGRCEAVRPLNVVVSRTTKSKRKSK